MKSGIICMIFRFGFNQPSAGWNHRLNNTVPAGLYMNALFFNWCYAFKFADNSQMSANNYQLPTGIKPLPTGSRCHSKEILSVSFLLWASICLLIYSAIISSVTLPLVTLKYPLPQYLFRNSGNSCWTFRELLPFITLITSLTRTWGGMDTKICIWSDETTPLIICTPSSSATWDTISRTRRWSSPRRILYRYFVIHTIWNLWWYLVWEPLLYVFMLKT